MVHGPQSRARGLGTLDRRGTGVKRLLGGDNLFLKALVRGVAFRKWRPTSLCWVIQPVRCILVQSLERIYAIAARWRLQ